MGENLFVAVGLLLLVCDNGQGTPSGVHPSVTPAPVRQDPNVVKIVSSLPRTGSANAQTTTIVNGVKMALEEAGWKVGNFRVIYEDWDDASAKKGDWDPEVEAANADKAVKDPDVMVYIGTYNSGAAKISIPVLNRAHLTMISPANTYPGLTKPGKGEPNEPKDYRPTGLINYFRVVPADDIQGSVGAAWAKKLGVKKAYVLDDRGLYGKGVADIFEVTCEDLGISVEGHEGYDPKAQEYRALMTKIKGKGVNLIYIGATTQTNAGQIVKDARAIGYAGKFMVPDGCYEQAFINAAGADNVHEVTYVTFGGVAPNKLTGRGAAFYKAYKAKYNSEPEGYAVYGYEAAQAALEAVRRAGKKDREAIRAACAGIKDFEGCLGKWSFDANGDTSLTVMSGQIVRNGKFDDAGLLGTN